MHNFVKSLVPRSARNFMPQTHKRVVVVGGGPTGLLCADRLRHQFDVTVIDSKDYFEFSPSILRSVVEPTHFSNITFDYREVLEGQLGVEFVRGEASKIEVKPGNLGAGTVTVSNGSKLFFDYCIASVGVGNGIWKPRTSMEPVTPSPLARMIPEAGDERTLDARRATLRSLRERIAAARSVLVVGAGLVGVELAAEVAHVFPQKHVTLVDGAADVLPQLGNGAREYARGWLQERNVKLNLSSSFVPERVPEDQVVLWCAGTKSRSAGLFTDGTVATRPNGQIRVNRQMQVLRSTGSSPAVPEPAEADGSADSSLEALGGGCVFAVGDAAAVEGVPTAQMIFHGEEMAAVAVANIEAREDVVPGLSQAAPGMREVELQLPFLCCTSLGPSDGMFSTQTELIATGALAAVQKQMIETTKMSALKGELAGSLLWYPVH